MSGAEMFKGNHRGRPRKGLWSVILPGQKGGDLSVPPQVHTYPTRQQAARVSRQVKGSRLAGPRRSGRAGRLVFWLIALGLIALGLYFATHART